MSAEFDEPLDWREQARMYVRWRTRGREVATIFHSGTLGEGFRAAQHEVREHWAEMIEGRRR